MADTADVLKRLRELQHLKVGSPMPSWLPANDWGNPLSELCGQAADLIESIEQLEKRIDDWLKTNGDLERRIVLLEHTLERMRAATQRIW
jgi:hypothetical protein